MWENTEEPSTLLSHDRPCPRCGHALHTYLGCDAGCGCEPMLAPGYAVAVTAGAAP